MKMKLSAFSYQPSARRVAIVAAVLVAAVAPAITHAGDAQQALMWLEAQQRPDGAWCDDILLRQGYGGQGYQPVCATVMTEVITAIRDTGYGLSGQENITTAASYMENVVAHDADTLSRKLSAISLQPSAYRYFRAEDIDALRALRLPDGGFSIFTGYQTTEVMDTMLALRFLAGFAGFEGQTPAFDTYGHFEK